MRYAWILLVTVGLAGRGVATAAAADAPATTQSGANVADTQTGTQYWFGVAVENLPPNVSRQLKLRADQGLIVDAVMHNSPAERAGIKPDDWLITLNGQIITSQDELALAANTLEKGRDGVAPRISTLKYLRDGDAFTTTLTPAPRPTNMLVSGNDLGNFYASQRIAPASPRGFKALNYAMPNGDAAQVGPGYSLNLAGEDFTTKSIKEVFSKGKTIVLSHEMDAAGNAHNTITVGDKVYTVETGQLDALPPDLRPLAEKLLDSGTASATQAADDSPAPSGDTPLSAEQRLEKVEKDNQELRNKLDEVNAQLKKFQTAK